MRHTGIDTLITIPVGATITRIYWAAPTTYGPGPEFASEAEAIAAGADARAEVIARDREHRGSESLVPERFSIDMRWAMSFPAGGGIDTIASRTTYDSLAEAREHLARIEKYATP